MTIRALKPSTGQITYWDETLKSFGLRISPGGTMTWTLLVGQERQRIKLGNYPIINLKKARELAHTHLAERTLGQHKRRAVTFNEALDTFEATHLKNLRPKTVYELKRLLKTHFQTKLGKKQLSDLDAHHITDITDRLTPGTAWHAFAAAQTFLNWTVARRYISPSPIAGVPSPTKSTARSRVLTDPELKAVWTAAEQIGGHFGTIVKLLILTGQRRGEIAALQTSWVQNDTLTIPAEIAKNGRQHSIPLSPLSTTLATGLATSRHSLTPYNAWSKPKKQLDRLSAISGYCLHDIRRTYRTIHARIGTPPHIAERLVNHISSTSQMQQVYDRYTYADEMKQAVVAYEAHLKSILKLP